jgi:hypothetical protein
VAGQWFSPCTLVSSTNETYCHNIIEILLKVASNTIPLNPISFEYMIYYIIEDIQWGK